MRLLVRILRRRRACVVGNRLCAAAAALIAAAAIAGRAGAAEPSARAAAELAMRRALSSSTAWTMERRLPKSAKALVSSGTVHCRLGESGIEWRTLKPFRSLVAMRGTSMVFEDEDGRRERPAADMPRYDDIRRTTDDFAAGRTDAFYEVFDAEAEFSAGGGWKVVIRPRIAALRELVESVEISGAELPTAATLRSANGTVSRLTFSGRGVDAD